MTDGALWGLRVLDFSRLAPGPFAGMILADLGADVVKVEEPGGGRRAREERELRRASSASRDDEGRRRRLTPFERNKRSICIDLRAEDGRKLALRLAEEADVVLEGFRPGVMERLGVGYADVHAVNPRAVYCSITGYGQHGPRHTLVGHDLNYIADSGVLSLFGAGPRGAPIVPPNFLADYAGGSLYAVIAILAALQARTRTGEGQYVDISMSDGALSLLGLDLATYQLTGDVPRAGATRLTGAVPYYNIYETADQRYLSVGCTEPYFYRALCNALDLPEHEDKQFSDPRTLAIVHDDFARVFRTRPLAEWLAVFEGKDIAVAPVRTLDEVLSDGHYRERNMIVELDDPAAGKVYQIQSPLHLSQTPPALRWLAPDPGSHTQEILSDLGLADDEVKGLYERGIIA